LVAWPRATAGERLRPDAELRATEASAHAFLDDEEVPMIGRAVALGLAATVLLSACGGPGASPDATSLAGAGSGKPGGWDADGKATFQVTGISDPFSDALGYSPSRSYFGGEAQTFLSFSNDGSDDTLIVQVTDGAVIIQYAGTKITIPSAECQVPDLKLDAAMSSGTFDCTASTTMNADGQTLPGARISGSFEARG
jgi:hypothetical protein